MVFTRIFVWKSIFNITYISQSLCVIWSFSSKFFLVIVFFFFVCALTSVSINLYLTLDESKKNKRKLLYKEHKFSNGNRKTHSNFNKIISPLKIMHKVFTFNENRKRNIDIWHWSRDQKRNNIKKIFTFIT